MNKDNYIYFKVGDRREITRLGAFDDFYVQASMDGYTIYGLKLCGANKEDYRLALYETENIDIARSVLERIASMMDAIEINEKGNFKYVGTNAENG